jgi:asparagine synthase (glutamine-hydrolysing)
MCGICGKFLYHPEARVPERAVHDMATLIAHRGPDDEGFHFDGSVGLGFRRLSIIDVSGGHQPMSNEDDRVWIVFNGEIYNHRELRAELVAKGHVFKTHADTETILHLYEEEGERCAERLRGMFAFAIWDARDRSLFAARDRFGIKPFYYRDSPEGFASTANAPCSSPCGGCRPRTGCACATGGWRCAAIGSRPSTPPWPAAARKTTPPR